MPIFRSDAPVTPKVQPYNAVRGLTASAARLNPKDKFDVESLRTRKSTQKWQEEAWDYFDAIGEVNYGFNLFANILSRIRLHAAYVANDQDNPTPLAASEASDAAKEATDKAMRAVFGGSKQSKLLRTAGINLLVVGECYLINEIVHDHGIRKENWRIVSTDELVPLGETFGLKTRKAQKVADISPLQSNAFVGRIWREHPRYSDEPNSSMRALCELCGDLLLLSRAVRATARSRLNAGALFIPDSFSVTTDRTTDGIEDDELEDYVDEEQDEFEAELITAMVTPISDEGSASSVVPLLIRGPSDEGEKIRHIKFERSFDVELAKRIDRTLDRILQGIDLPKEIVSGLSQVKYANANNIDQMFYTAHIEPLVILLCDMFRSVYLEPYLYKAGIEPEEIEKIVIWYDPSGITTAPDRSTAANVGFDKYALSADAWRRANGFDEDDAPTTEEIANRLALTRGQLTPETTDLIFSHLFPDIMAATREAVQENSAAPIPDSVQNLIDPATTEAPPPDPGADTANALPPTDGPLPPEGLIE